MTTQATMNAILEVIQPGAIERVAADIALAIYRDPCKFLSPEDAEALRRGRRVDTDEMDRKDAIINGLVKQRDLVIKAVGDERDARIADCRELNDKLSHLKSGLAGMITLKAKLEEKIKNQRERINYLEGATHHAGGTPLSNALEELEAEKAKVAELRGIVDTLRNDLSKKNEKDSEIQSEAGSNEIELYHIKMLLRSLGHSNFNNMATRLSEIISDYSDTAHHNTLDASRWRALLASARIRMMGSAGIDNPRPDGYAHFGMEIWTIHGDVPEGYNELGKRWLRGYADIMREVLAKKEK